MTRLNEAETSIREKGTISADGKKTHQGNVIKLSVFRRNGAQSSNLFRTNWGRLKKRKLRTGVPRFLT